MGERIYLHSLSIKNFKSFPEAEIVFLPGFNVIIGPNGAGKSNVCDAIRFVFGEKRLSVLRVKSVKDLVLRNKKLARVIAVLKKGEEEYIIEREVDTSGRSNIRLNGKRVTLKDLKAFISRYGISPFRMVIGQGEITKIASMKPRDLKKWMDEVAGIFEYEVKKQEALKNIESVDQRIRETNILLGEKLKALEMLKAEVEKLRKYKELSKFKKNIQYTILYNAVRRLEKIFEDLTREKEFLMEEKYSFERDIEEALKNMKRLEEERDKVNEEILKITQEKGLTARLEEISRNLAVKEEKLKHLEEKEEELNREIEELQKRIEETEEEIVRSQKEGKELEKKGESIKIDTFQKSTEELQDIEKKAFEISERLNSLLREKEKVEERIKVLNEMLSNLKIEESFEDVESFKKELQKVKHKSIEMMRKEGELNKSYSEIEKRMLKIKEKISELRAYVRVGRSDETYRYLLSLQESGKIFGIIGRVIDIIDFDEGLSQAVESAGGSRLSYIVVENLDVAKKSIEILKREKLGVTTFIPLKELRASFERNPNSLINFITYDDRYEKAVAYVFGDTILVKNFEEARKYLGKKRVVTLDGVLFENSGVVSGGYRRTMLTLSKQLSQLEEELEKLKYEREGIRSELEYVKEELSSLRSYRSKLEARLELVEKEKEKFKKKEKEIVEKRSRITAEINELESRLLQLQKEIEVLEKEKESILRKKEELLRRLKVENEEQMKKLTELTSYKASLLERARALFEKSKSLSKELVSLRERLAKVFEERESVSSQKRVLMDEVLVLKAEKEELEEEFVLTNERIKDLREKLSGLEEEIRKWAGKEYSLREKVRALEKKLREIEMKEVEVKTELKIKEEELKSIDGEYLEMNEGELEEKLREVEYQLESIGDVNFVAEDMYSQLQEEVGEVKAKYDKLKEEKDAILQLISDIERRKRVRFLEVFEKINREFQSLTESLPNFGKATLYLTNKEDIDNSGVSIRVERNSFVVPLSSLSGGELSLLSIMLIFASQRISPSPIYVFDEADASLDVVNSSRFGKFIKSLSGEKGLQFLVVSHNDAVIEWADNIITVSRGKEGSKVYTIKKESISTISSA